MKNQNSVYRRIQKMRSYVKVTGYIALFMLVLSFSEGFAQSFSFSEYVKKLDIQVTEFAAPTFVDIDNDNDLDLFVGERYGTIDVFINDGEGVYTYMGKLQADGSDVSIGLYSVPVFADIDNDNDFDLYIGEQSGNINVFRNDGNGDFTSLGNLNADGFGIDVGSFSTPMFADIDNDNDLDLYVGEQEGNINVFINDGTGTFLETDNLQAGGSYIDIGSYSRPIFEDVDGDNDMDLFIGENSGKIFTYLNNGSGVFSSNGQLQADGSDINLITRTVPCFADLDEDNDLDLYVGYQEGYI
jgi:hypothetical protein